MIYIFTGPIRSGKTTSLLNWSMDRDDVGGFLTPDSASGRVLVTLPEASVHPMETDTAEEVYEVGRFCFAQKAFQMATQHVESQLDDAHIRYVILDEIGKLELRGSGHHALLKTTLSLSSEKIIVLVCRDSLVVDVRKRYLGEHRYKEIKSANQLPLNR